MQSSTFLITYRDYELSGPSIIFRLFGRDSEGNRVLKHVSGTAPYFYIPSHIPVIEDPRIVKVVSTTKKSIFGDSLTQIFTQKPGDIGGSNPKVQYLRDMYETTFEADLLYDYRCAVDFDLNGIVQTPSKIFLNVSDITPSTLPPISTRKFTFDVENRDDGSIEDAKNGDKEVYIITLHDSFTNIYHIFTSYMLNVQEKEEVTNTLNNHWKDNKYYPEFSTPLLQYHESEGEVFLFENLFQFIEQNRPDILTGFNSNGFDIPVVYNRSKKLGLDPSRLSEFRHVDPKRPKISGLALMDLQTMYKEYQQGTIMYPSLDYVGGTELETKKLPRVSILELYQTNRAHLTAYNIIDVQLCVGVERKNALIDFYTELSILTYTSLEDFNRSAYVDNLLFLEVKKTNEVLPSKNKERGIALRGKKGVGGKVYEALPGLHKNVPVVDFRGMYPEIIMGINISPDVKTIDGEMVAANGIRFSSKKVGIIPKILKNLKETRAKYKRLKKDAEIQYETNKSEQVKALIEQYELKQYAIKILMNVFYGVLRYVNFRLLDPDVANAITTTGQYLSMSCKEFVNQIKIEYKGKIINLKVIYGDTDSIFIEIFEDYNAEELKEISTIIVDEINKHIDKVVKKEFNVQNHNIEIEFDNVFKILFQVSKKSSNENDKQGAKKRYAAITYKYNDEGKCIGTKEKIKGFELVKASSAKITKNVQTYLLKDLILNEVPKSEIRSYLLNLKEDFFNKKIPIKDFATRAPLNKAISEYPDGPEIRGIQNAIKHLKRHIPIGYVGSYYCVSKSPSRYPAHKDIVLDFDEDLPLGYEIDYEEVWKKKVESPAMMILEAYDMDWENVETGKAEAKATSFFNAPQKNNTPEIDDAKYELIDVNIIKEESVESIPKIKTTLGLFR